MTTSKVSDPSAWHLLSVEQMRTGRLREALRSSEKAVHSDGSNPAYHIQLGRCLAMAGLYQNALTSVDVAENLGICSAQDLDSAGTILSHCDEQTRALSYFEKAVKLEPTSAHLYNLATAQRMTGDLAAAEITCDRVIALNSHDYKAYFTRANLRTYTAADNHIKQMVQLINGPIKHTSGEVLLRYAIAKECEDIGDFSASFYHLRAGADLQRRQLNYCVDDEIAVIDMIIKTHTNSALSGYRGSESNEPIFVVGMPRTGTTLVERILGSHADVHSLGELSNFPFAIQRALASVPGASGAKPIEMVAASLKLDFAALGDTYVKSTRPKSLQNDRFIDKFPQNYLNCGLIHAALPNARIVHLVRDPMDSCYAIYKTFFTRAYPFSYDQEELGKYFLAYERLMDHWRSTLGDAILDVSYEALVNETEQQTRRLLEYCGLPWQDSCLEFHKSAAPSTTASASQVRRPIYRNSIGRWRDYEKELRPLAKVLRSS